MILLIDNYDSFVHNLARYFRRLGEQTCVVRNDATDVAAVRAMQPDAVVLSPGPCTPTEAGCSMELVRALAGQIPVLGVCLGHQAIAAALGGRIVRAPTAMHGRVSAIQHDEQGIFEGVPNPVSVCRYHSLIVDESSLPEELEVTARTDEGIVMALRHRHVLVVGVQFHPEAILTQHGFRMLANFLRMAGRSPQAQLSGRCDEWLEPAVTSPSLPDMPVTF